MSLKVITDANEFDKIQPSWDEFVVKTGTNWHFLGEVVRAQMARCRSQGGIPLVVLGLTEGHVVGVCAFEMRHRLGLRYSNFLLPTVLSPDFLVEPEYHQSLVEESLDFLLRRMRCRVVTLDFPTGSPQEAASKAYFAENGLRSTSKKLGKHSVLLVDGIWKDFERRRGSNFRNHFKKIESKLTERGPWRIVQAKANSAECITKIATVESHSWKHEGTGERSLGLADLDPTLLDYTSYHGSQLTDQLCPRVWFLELQDTPIAFAIAAEINGVACLAKTSYDSRYRNLYPGEYVQNAVIRSLLDSKLVFRIDFMTFLPYHRRWTSSWEDRETLRISLRGFAFSALDAVVRRFRLAKRVAKRQASYRQFLPQRLFNDGRIGDR